MSAAPLHERLEGMAHECAIAADGASPIHRADFLVNAATLREAAAALRQPDGEVGALCERLQAWQHRAAGLSGCEDIAADIRAALAHLRRRAAVQAEPRLGVWPALRDVAQERCRQTSAEGRSASHDDDHDDGALAKAAAVYALLDTDAGTGRLIQETWPWEPQWLKPKDKRRNLVRAAALLIAEIERLDRALAPAPAADPAAALRPPEGEVGLLCERLERLVTLEEALTVDADWHKRRATDLRAALAHLRRLGQVEAERASWKRWTEQAEAKVAEALAWAVSRWKAEVENRPLRNIYHRPLDDTWRQVVRHFGGDDEALLGPRHDDAKNSST